jgi:surfactin synthase thioesterase subunit
MTAPAAEGTGPRGPMSDPGPWLTTFGRPATGAPRLVCLAGAGAFPSEFHAWPGAFGATADVAAVVLPGRERRIREPGITDMAALVDALAGALRPWTGAPLALFGHSFGALVMFELARRLSRTAQDTPVHLFVSAQPGPGTRERFPASTSSDEELADYIRSFGGAPEEILGNAAFMRAYYPGMRADLALCENYRYRPAEPLRCPLTAYYGTEDTGATRDAVGAWAAETGSRFDLVPVVGGHLFLRDSLGALVEDMTARLRDPAGRALQVGEAVR